MSDHLHSDGEPGPGPSARNEVEPRVEIDEGEPRVRTLQAIFDSVPDGAFVCDGEGRCLAASATGCALLGQAKTAVVGRAFVEHVLPSHVGRWRELLEEVRTAAVARTEITLVCADNVALPVVIVARTLALAGSASGATFFFVRDARDRSRAESALARARAELESIARSESVVPDVIATLPQTGLEIALNTIAFQAQVRTGASVVSVVLAEHPSRWIVVGATRPRDIIADGEEVEELVRGVIEQGRAVRDPAVRYGNARISTLVVPLLLKGHVEGAILLANKQHAAAFDDDDERIAKMTAARASAALASVRVYDDEAHEHAWLQSIFDQMPEGVTIFDAKGNVVQRNPMARTTGELCTLDGTPIPLDETPAVRALHTGQTITSVELALRTPRGELVPVLVSAAPIHNNNDGTRSGAIMLCREILAMKTRERMKDEWATIICHDLRQPVGVIGLTAESLERQLKGRAEQKQIDGLRRIVSASERLQRMIDDLADASLIEADRLHIETRALDIGALAERVAVNAFESSGRRVDVRRSGASWVSADADRVEQVLTNLVSNAIKYGDPDRPIAILVENGATDHIVSVVNFGRGIPPDEIASLFDRFARGRRDRGSSAKGLGLGLYIARGLIEAQHGRLWVRSNAELTTFAFSLPRAGNGSAAS